jgi:hypothetical protein
MEQDNITVVVHLEPLDECDIAWQLMPASNRQQ